MIEEPIATAHDPSQPSTTGGPHKVLIVDDSPVNRELLRRTLEPEGFNAFLVPSGEVAIQVAQRVQPTLILMDVRMPGGLDGFETCLRLKADPSTASIPIIFITVDDDEETIVRGFAVGGVDYIPKPFKEREVVARVQSQTRIRTLTDALLLKNNELRQEIELRKRAELDRDLADQQLDAISQQELNKCGLPGFVGQSPAIRRMIEDIRKLHTTDSTSVLILGESGTGKELIARAIHFGGARRKGPFIAMNCSAIPSELAESTLFGHVQGAFTGAKHSQKGCFELADGGTLFLDEIGDMPYLLQTKLLRVLDDNVVTPIGSTQPRKVNVRVIAATHRHLAREIQLKHFRHDLYFRLSRFVVASPSLRERSTDLPLLINHFIKLLAREMGLEAPSISQEALQMLERYHFPGNVRELKNIIEHALIRSGGVIEARDLPPLEPLGLRPLPPDPSTHTDAPVLPSPYSTIPTPPQESSPTNLSTAAPSPSQPLDPLSDLKRIPVRRNEDSDELRVREFLKRFETINNAECCELLNLPTDRSYLFLNKLVSLGRLTRTGERRWTRYHLTAPAPPNPLIPSEAQPPN